MNQVFHNLSKLLTASCLFCLLSGQINAQVISDGNLPEALVVCGEPQTIEVIVTGPYAGGELTATLPPGYNYIGMAASNAGCGSIANPDPDAPVFNVPMLSAAISCTISYDVMLDCDAFLAIDENQGGNGDFLFIIEYELDNGTTGSSAPTIMTQAPKLNVDIITNGSPAPPGTIFTRTVRICQDGPDAYVDDPLMVGNDYPGDLTINSITVQGGGTYTPDATGMIVIPAAEFANSLTRSGMPGNGDNLLNGSDSSDPMSMAECIYLDYEMEMECSNDDLIHKIITNWGCEGEKCAIPDTTSLSTVAQIGTPILSRSIRFDPNKCFGEGPVVDTLIFTNTGNGDATDIDLIIDVSSNGTNYTPDRQTFLDAEGVTTSIDGAPFSLANTTSLSTASASAMANCDGSLGPADDNRFNLVIPELKVGETIRIAVPKYHCCRESCQIAYYYRWKYIGTMQNACGEGDFTIPVASVGTTTYTRLDHLPTLPSDVFDGDCFTANFFTATSQFYGQITNNPDSRAILTINLPCSLKYDDYTWIKRNGTTTMDPLSLNYNPITGDLVFEFSGAELTGAADGVNIFKSNLDLDLKVDCADCGSGTQNISYEWTFDPDINCDTDCLRTIECFNNSLVVHCPNPCPWDGITPIGFELCRTTFGLEDLDNDMCNDNMNTASPEDAKKDLSTLCDQVEGEITAVVNVDAAVPATNFFEYGYANTNGYGLEPIGGRLEWWDESDMTWKVCPDVDFTYNGGWDTDWDFSPSTLCANGCASFCGEVFETGDTIKLYPLYENVVNIGGAINLYTMDMDIYGATIPNPPANTTTPCSDCDPIVYPDNRYTCDKFSANYSIVGYYFTTYGSFIVNRTGCQATCTSNNWYLSVGPCCSNYTGGNLFPYEYRPLGILDSVYTIIPYDFTLDSWSLTFNQSHGTQNVASPAPMRVGAGPNGDTLWFDVGALYDINGGPVKVSDEGYVVRLNTCITPTCANESGPSILRGCGYQSWLNCDESPQGTTAPNSVLCRNTTPTYEMPTISVQSNGRIQSGDCPGLEWPIRITNTNNIATANNTWLYFPPGTISITDVTNGGTSMTPTNGFYDIGNLSPTSLVDLTVTGDFNSCQLDSIPALIGWECADIPNSINDINCDPDTIWLVVEPQKPAFAIEVLQPTVSNVEAELCEEIDYELLYKNIGSAKAYDLRSYVYIPSGTELVPGSVMIEYACGSGYESWTFAYPSPLATSLGDLLIFDVTNESNTNPNIGPIGVAPDDGWAYPSISEVENCYKIKFKVKTTCDLGASGQLVRTVIFGKSPCSLGGDPTGVVRSNLENVGSISINGANPYVMGVFGPNNIDFVACSEDLSLDFNFELQSATTTGTGDSVIINIPNGFSYISDNYGTPTISTSGTSTRLAWAINPPLMGGDDFDLSLDLDIDPSVIACGTENITVETVSEFTSVCVDDGSDCMIPSVTGSMNVAIDIDKPGLSIAMNQALASCGSGATLSTNIEATITNSGPAIAADASFPVVVYTNNDGTCSLFGDNTELTTIMVNGPIAAGASFNISETINVPAEACYLLMEIQDCACDGAGLADCIELDMSLPTQAVYETCHNVPLDIMTCNNPLFTYTWTPILPALPGDITAGSSTGMITIQPTNTTGVIQTYKYAVRIERGIGCQELDTIDVTVRPDVTPAIITAEVVAFCPGDAQTYTYSSSFSSTTNSIVWSVPAGASIISGQGTSSIEVDFGTAAGQICVTADDGTCTIGVQCIQVDPDPDLCCDLMIVGAVLEECNDNGTPTDPSDDYFSITMTATADNPGVDDMYEIVYNGTVISASPYNFQTMAGTSTTPPFVADGTSTYDLIIRDKNWPADCFEEITVGPIGECSDECAFDITQILQSECNDNGTPSHPIDDYFTITVNADAINDAGSVYEILVDGILIGSSSFGTPTTVGSPAVPPFVADGVSTYVVEVRSQLNPDCSQTFMTTPVESCSDLCVLTIDQFVQGTCNDNGTPSHPSDDWYSITVNASALNPSVSNQYEVVVGGAVIATGTYGTQMVIGSATSPPFVADGATMYMVQFRDVDDNMCTAEFTTIAVESCSDLCDLTVESFVESSCNNNGTPLDPSDDHYTFDIDVSVLNPGPTNMFEVVIGAAGNGAGGTVIGMGTYGTVATIGTATSPPFIADGSTVFTLTVRDYDDPICHEDITVGPVEGCPAVVHDKQLTSVTQTGIGTYDVKYIIEVENLGFGDGEYTLVDIPGFDDDFVISSATYMTDAMGNAANPGPISLSGTGPWTLASSQAIDGMSVQTYMIMVSVILDLDTASAGDNIYTSCGSAIIGDPTSGEGLYNMSTLDSDNDGTVDQMDEVCADVPHIEHTKELTSITQNADLSYDVIYTIEVCNSGGISGDYTLMDEPLFDDDVIVNTASFSSDVPNGNILSPYPPPAGGWVLSSAQSLNANACHTFSVEFNVSLDLDDPMTPGDGTYTECGAATPGNPGANEGLYNRSNLDINNDGISDEVDEACGDLPHLTLDKSITSLTQTGPKMWTIIYEIEVCNDGGANGMYDLLDTPGFDDDVIINSATVTTDAMANANNPGPTTLTGSGPWTFADDQVIMPNVCQLFTLTANVTMDLTDPAGDGVYASCEDGTPGDPTFGEGLYNMSSLDENNDGTPDTMDEVCTDLPAISHEKSLTSITQTGARTYDVKYTIIVSNDGGATGEYGLMDTPLFDDDIIINGAEYMSDATANAGNPGPFALSGTGPWSLANSQAIDAGVTQTYMVVVSVEMDLLSGGTPGDGIYTACGDAVAGESAPGEGLHNESDLDLNNDGVADEEDEACGDLPDVHHEKTISSVTIQPDGSYDVVYSIVVTNCGGVADDYGLIDLPSFDDDIVINTANYTTNASPNNGNPGPETLLPVGPWTLATAQNIAGGCTSHTYTINLNVSMDLEDGLVGDDAYTACGEAMAGDPMPGEGLYNSTELDITDDGVSDEEDEVCADLPYLIFEKSIVSLTQTGPKMWTIIYEIEVCNDGGANGMYDLVDAPGFDDDVIINSATVTTDAMANPSNPGPTTLTGSGPWTFADDQVIMPNDCQVYTLSANVTMDLTDPATPGDGVYTSCEDGTPGDPTSGEGLYNMTSLDVDNDGVADLTDEVCADLPAISHEKSLTSITQTGARTYDVKYTITVSNDGGATGEYGLMDTPLFDDDIIINGAEYMSDATANAGNPGPFALSGIGPWSLANSQAIDAGVTQTYMVVVSVEMDLQSASTPGDGMYAACNDANPGVSSPGEGLLNESDLDLNNDGIADEEDEACGDLPNVHHEKTINDINIQPDGTYDVIYRIVVTNCGGANGTYNLVDIPQFDDDITINSASYTSNAASNPGNPGPSALSTTGPWTLATTQIINGGCSAHVYTINVNVDLDLVDGVVGDDIYTACGSTMGGVPMPGEALYNATELDVTGDNVADEVDDVCADLPNITMDKTISSLTQTGPKSWTIVYEVEVCNGGGAVGTYDLNDMPGFDDDVVINSASLVSDVVGNPNNPGPTSLTGSGPWNFADDQAIMPNACHVYTLSANVSMDLTNPTTPGDGIYTSCEEAVAGDPSSGEGIYNMTSLDVNNDAIADLTDEVCADLPAISHEKNITSITQTGARTYDVKYTITVSNDGGASGDYGLVDTPLFDDDILINAAEYMSDAPSNSGNPGPFALSGIGPWSLANMQAINPSATHTYMVTVSVELDLLSGATPGDGQYTKCGSVIPSTSMPGEGLHNESDLDLNNDGVADEEDEACGDLPDVHHEKTLVSIDDMTGGNYQITYNIVVTNCGGAADTYSLVDAPSFDDDITINSASYLSTAPGNPENTIPFNLTGSGPWNLATNQNILGDCTSHSYQIVIDVTLDLTDEVTGDDIYTACGTSNGGAILAGEGLFNESQLDITEDGVADEVDEVCADLPAITLEKTIDNVLQTGPRTWTVKYNVVVCNDGGANGTYDLDDVPNFDNDIVILSSAYNTDATGNPANPGPVSLTGNGPWNLADDQIIAPGDCQTYSLSLDVMMDLTDPNSPGDDSYSECGASNGMGDPSPGEGLYNQAVLDSNNDGNPDLEDEVCADLPAITHDKELTSITQVGARDFEVKYTITVQNDGGAPGMYDLTDEIFFEDDIVITCANYTSDAPLNPANPGPVNLALSGIWSLGDDMTVTSGASHTYCLIVCVSMDLRDPNTPGDGNYDACGSGVLNGMGMPGQGLYNESYFDLDNDGINDEEDNACGDLPYIWHEKEFVSFMPMANGNNMITYEICVRNTGGADGDYDLWDEPIFDDDVSIVAASYSCDTDPGATLASLVPAGGWLLLDDQTIAPSATQCCTIEIEVDIDFSAGSGGDNMVTQCGAANGSEDSQSGEALYNASTLDVNNDGTIDEMDEACGDIAMIEHEKSIASVTQNSDDSYCIVYNILVTNMSTTPGFYDLYDLPQFDADIVILSADYSSSVHIPTNLPSVPPVTGWQLANDISVGANGSHIYTLEVCVIMDLQDPVPPGGDNDYTSCGETSGTPDLTAGEGLFNESILDTNDDGVADELDTVCADLPYVTHTKAFVDAYRNTDGTYTAEFKITVENIGGASGLYDLWDQPNFDDDFEILSASYTTDAVGAAANPGPTALTGTGPWTLADDQAIDADVTQCYNLSVIVDINLSDPNTVGDELYTGCGSANGPMDPEPGEGFYNESFLDRSNDGTPEEVEETCGDIEIVDLAIQKQIVTPGPYQYGQVVEFVHTIYNQGNVPMYNVQLSDYLPAGFGFAGVAGNDANWSQTSPTLLDYSFIAGPIAPASSTTVTLFLEILPTTGGNEDWWNYSEISSMEDENGMDRSAEDIDSNPDSDPNDDNQPEPLDVDDDVITAGGPDAGEDEDDHDVAGIEIFDLAKIKTTAATGPFSYGDEIPFTITIFNQGSETATDISIVDHLPCGFRYLASNDGNGWSYDAASSIAGIIIDGPLLPGDMTTVTLNVELQQCLDSNPSSFLNISEINGGNGDEGNPGDDIDSTADNDPDNDGVAIDNEEDDPNDEDDHDPEEIAIYDLAQIKELITQGPYAYGQLLEFNVKVCNQGNQTVQNIQLTDYLPVGYSFDLADQSIAWTMNGTNLEYTIAAPLAEDSCVDLPLFLTIEATTGGDKDWINYSEITYFEDENGGNPSDADSNPGSDGAGENDVEPGDLSDDDLDSTDEDGEEDDHDPAGIEIFDLAQIKTTTATGPFSYGDVIPFTITVFNQGSIPATDITIVDHLPCGQMYLASNDANGWMYDMTSGAATIIIEGPLMPGATMDVVVEVALQQCIDNDPDSFTNVSEILSANDDEGNPGDDIDSTADNDPDNDGDAIDNEEDDPNDEDDHDPEEITIYDLAQIKELITQGPYAYGQLLEFNVKVCNQGNQTVQNIQLTDYLPVGYSFDQADQSTAWTMNGTNLEYTIAAPLAEDSCVDLPLFLTIEATTGGDKDWINYSEITYFEDENGGNPSDADSNPGSDGAGENDVEPGDLSDDDLDSTYEDGEEDDHDPAGIEIFDLAQIKTTTATGPFSYGDVIPFTITVFNQGSIPATDITIVDHLPCGQMYLASNDANGWMYDMTSGAATIIIEGPLMPGATMDVVVEVALQQCIDNDPDSFTNVSEILSANDDEGNPGDDIDSTADNDPDNDGDAIDNEEDDPNDEDDHDPEEITIYDLAQIKELITQGPYAYGQLLEFNVKVCNQGNQTVQNIQLTDYLPVGYSFDQADQSTAWTMNGTNLEYTIAAPLAEDSCVDLPLFLTIEATTGGDKDWINYSEITYFEDENGGNPSDADSNPGSDGAGENDVEPGDLSDDDLDSTYEDGEEDDHDPAGIEIFDLAQIKTTTATGPFSYGDVIPFTITVFNQGSIPATDITIVDHLPCGQMYLASNDANGWMYDMTSGAATIIIEGPLMPGATMDVVVEVALQQCIDNDPDSFTNVSEILSANDDEGNPGDDIDSTADNDPDNDGDAIDNEEDDPNDEDDHDPEEIAIYDLAQIKELITQGPYAYGQLLEFNVKVCNQGNQTVQNIQLTDYLPVGYGFDQADQSTAWTMNGTNLEYTIAAPLAEDSCVDLPLFLTIEATTGGDKDWINYSEITYFEDENGGNPSDADSNPGSDGAGENDVEPGDLSDDDLDSTDEDGEEDDHDPAGIEIFDLAQIKTTTATGPFSYGDVIPFTITVFNQGSIPATDITIVDHLPCGQMYLASNDANGWMYDMTSGAATIIIEGPLMPGATMDVVVEVALQQCIDNDPDSFTNVSEILSANDDEGNPGDDIDSTADNDPDNDGDAIDNEEDDPNDEDDHDLEEIAIYDLAQIKELITQGPYAYGQLLEFNVKVCNQGNQTVQNIQLTDYLPVGYSFDQADQSTAWTMNGTNLEYTIAAPLAEDSCVDLPLFLKLEPAAGGAKDWINYSEITYFEDENGGNPSDADSNPGSDGAGENDVEPGDLADDDLDSTDEGGEEDDHDPAGIVIFDLAQIKTTTASAPFYYGDMITFTIEVFNQGSVVATDIDIIDHIPCGYVYLDSNDGIWSYDGIGQAMTTIDGPLLPGESTTVDITLEIQQCVPNSLDAFLNVSEIAEANDGEGNSVEDFDSTADNDPNNDGDPVDNENDGPNDEDDHDIEDIQIWDLSQIKEVVTDGPYSYGQLIEFAITVCNQGNQPAQNINIIDYLPSGYSFDLGSQVVSWYETGMGTDIAYTIPSLSPEDCITIPLYLTIEMSSGGANSYTNISEITYFEGPNGGLRADADSDPDDNAGNDGDPIDNVDDDPNDEDDHDPEMVRIYDLALIKETVTAGPHVFGDLVEFSFTIFNQGSVDASSVTIHDYLPCGLIYDQANNNAWTFDGSLATYEYNNVIPAGASANVSIFLTVVPCDSPGAWYNEAEIGAALDDYGNSFADIDSAPDSDPNNDGDPINDENNDAGDEDDNDPEDLPVFDIALRKSIQERGPYAPGEIADFEIEIFNQGNVDAYNVEITDYLNVGFVFDATLNPGWIQNGDNITYIHNGPLVAGTSDLVHIYLEIAVPAGATLDSWINEAEVSRAENEVGELQVDADSDLDANPDNDNDVLPGDQDDDEITEHANGEDEDDNDVADVIVTGEIGNLVWKDLDGNGIQDPGESGVEGVVVNLYDCTGIFIRSVTTDANGYYLFDLLLPGGYQLEFDITGLPEGCDWTYQDQGGDNILDSDVDADGMTECIEVEGGEMNHDVDAGLIPLAKIGDLVWQDCDGDGQQSVGELGLPNIQVLLFNTNGVLLSTTYTDMNGAYLFDNLYPDEYYLQIVAPEEYMFTDPKLGSNDAVDSDVNNGNGEGATSIFTLSPGECDLNSGDAGLYKCVQIGELVWFDTNENNVWDAQENGVNGLKVNLYKQGPNGEFDLHDYTYTGYKPGSPSDDGYFKFCVAPGTYYLEFAQPPYGMVPALANQGNFETIDSDVTHTNGDGTTDTFSVRCGEDKCDIGAGYYPMGTIGDYVWLDDNQNGMRDPNENGLANVMVEAYDVYGNMLGFDNTDDSGQYFIDYLQATDVYLKFTPPSGYAPTLPNQTMETMDSDITNSNGPMTTQYYNIVPGSHIPNVDAGLIYGVVPVEWISFEGENRGNYNQLDWTVASQIDVSHYEVERSIDNLSNFTTIGKKLSEGSSSEIVAYDYQDYDVATPGTYYYRIKQLDLNGNTDYTEVIAIDIESIRVEQPKASVYPNPMVDDFTLELTTHEDGLSIEYIIMDVDGKLVTKRTSLAESVTAGKHLFMLSAKELSAGIYTMRISAGTTIVNKKLIVVSN